jgi:hypothetical protein
MRRQPLGSRSPRNYAFLNTKSVTLQQMQTRPFVGGPSGTTPVQSLASNAKAFSLVGVQAASRMSDAGGLQPLQVIPNIRTNTRCSLQYNSLWIDAANVTYFGFWDVSFHPADPSQAFSRSVVHTAPHPTPRFMPPASGGTSMRWFPAPPLCP